MGIAAGSLPYIRPLFQRRSTASKRSTSASRIIGVPYGSSITVREDIVVKEDVEVEVRSLTPFDDLGTRAVCNEKRLN